MSILWLLTSRYRRRRAIMRKETRCPAPASQSTRWAGGRATLSLPSTALAALKRIHMSQVSYATLHHNNDY